MTTSNIESFEHINSLPPIPPRRAFVPRRMFLLIAYAPTAGVILAWFAYLLMLDRLEAGRIFSMFLVAGFMGFIFGCVCLPAVYLLLRHKDPEVCLPLACWTVIGGIVLSTTLPLSTEKALLMQFAAPAWLAIAIFVLGLWAPRRYFGLDICHYCGYDLRASAASGRCPECGWRFHDSPLDESARKRPLRRAAGGIVRHPLLVLLLLNLFAGLSITWDWLGSTMLRRHLRNAAHRQLDAGQPLDLTSVTSFDWDTAHVIEGYSTRADVAKQLGFSWNKVGRTGIANRDDIQVLVFVKGRRVACYTVLPQFGTNGIAFTNERPIDRSNARLAVVALDGNSGIHLKPFAPRAN